jgi:hypothetical protein
MTPIIILIIGLIIGAGLAAVLYGRQRQQRASAYVSAKQALQQNPHDQALKGRFVICGRRYYRSLRRLKLSTQIEQAIAQDLMAILGASDQGNASHN